MAKNIESLCTYHSFYHRTQQHTASRAIGGQPAALRNHNSPHALTRRQPPLEAHKTPPRSSRKASTESMPQ